MKPASGYSKLSKQKKLDWVVENFFHNSEEAARIFKSFWHPSDDFQKIFDGISENTLTNYFLPYGIAPNFLINDKTYCVPMVIEESSVVAAASAGAKFWSKRGGFKAKIVDTKKVGQVHFLWNGDPEKINRHFAALKALLFEKTEHLTCNMQKRGGGILDIQLLEKSELEPGYYQLHTEFDTCDSMGANFINSILEEFAKVLRSFFATHPSFEDAERDVNIIMCILSNYTPDCLVKTWVECPVEDLGTFPNGIGAEEFAKKFELAVRIAANDVHRAATHNKGIFNGIDAVVLATGNDFRAIESGGHAYAARSGQYRGLSHCTIKDGMFRFGLDFPLAVGTVGGLTTLHPLAKYSMEMLGRPDAKELMQIIVCVGLAQNFAALRSLVTTGIQYGHMKMHLKNILIHLGANDAEVTQAMDHFKTHEISFTAVREYLNSVRKRLNGSSVDTKKKVV